MTFLKSSLQVPLWILAGLVVPVLRHRDGCRVMLLYGDGFGEVAGAVWVAAEGEGGLVGEFLERDHGGEGCQEGLEARDEKYGVGDLGEVGVAFVADGDEVAVARLDLVEIG